MNRLVALDIPAGPAFLDALRRAFDDGDAVWPVDPRLPAPARERLFAAVHPTHVTTGDATTVLAGGIPVEAGDALVVTTSGTTGDPKAAVLTLDAVVASARATSTRLGVDPSRDRWCACLPLAHVGGLSVLTRALVTGTPVDVLAEFDPMTVMDAARRGATLVSLVPRALGRLGDPSRFRVVLLGGSAPPGDRLANVVATYGMTETGSGVVYEGEPLDDVDVAIGPDGQIALRGPMLLRAYRDGRDPKDEDGWLWTGDTGALGEDGRLTVFGRSDECIITGGENVWPDAVEAVIRTHAAVREVAVAGVGDPEWGERVVAFVVSDTDLDLAELRELVRGELGAVAAPRELVQLDALPRTPSGKVRRGVLRATAARR